MSITKERVEELVKELTGDEKNTGSPEVQIAIATDRILNITEHLKVNKHDHSGRRGLIALVSQRRKLLNYIKKTSVVRYRAILEKMDLRK